MEAELLVGTKSRLAFVLGGLLLATSARAQTTIPHNETTAATTPVNGCMFFDQGASGGTDTKLCAPNAAGWATAYGFGPLALSASLSAALDTLGSTQGGIIYRGATLWTYLSPGTSGQFLQTLGSGANPQWAATGSGGTPGGANTNAQFNNSGSFGGSTGLDLSTTKVLSMSIGLGSDATGDIYYNGGSGTFTRLPIGTPGQVLKVTSGLPAWGAATGGSTGYFTGTVIGSGTYTSTTVQGAFANAAYSVFCGIFTSTNTAAATLNLDSAGALPINVQNAGGTPLATTGQEIVPGASCYQVNAAGSAFTRLTTYAGHITRDPTSPHPVTLAEWNNGETFVFDAAASGTTLTFPSAPTLSAQSGINVQVIGPNTPLTLTPQSGADGFNGNTAGTSIFVTGQTSFSVTSTGATGVNAFQAPTGNPDRIDMTWMPGQDLTTAHPTLRGSYASYNRIVTGIKCTPDIPVSGSGTATLEFRYAPSATAINAGTLISAATAFNAAGTINVEQTLTLFGSAAFIVVPPGNRIGWVAAGTNWTSTGGGTGGISSGAGGCTITVF